MLLAGTLVTSDKERIACHHYKNNYDKIIIIAHGFYASKENNLLKRLAKELCKGYDVFMFDFRGHGKSSGLFTWTSKEGEDLKAVLEYLEGKYEKTGIIAFSLGGSISINVLSETDVVDSLVCVCAPSDVEKIDYKLWELDWEQDIVYNLLSVEGKKGKGVRPGPFWLKKKRPINSVGKIKIPILYIHGERDWIVKPWHSKALYEKTNSKKKLVIVKNGPHAEFLMRKYPKQFVSRLRAWFKNTLK